MNARRMDTIENVELAIRAAENVLPGQAVSDGQPDPRWQAIIALGRFIETEPAPIWSFIRRWGSYPDDDLSAAIATCLLEHLLEAHFATYLDEMEWHARDNPRFARTLSVCWGVATNAGATANDLAALRALFNCDVPNNIRDFYRTANGMTADQCDAHGVWFWSIQRMCAEHAASKELDIGFADVLIESWRFVFRIESGEVCVMSQNVAPGLPLARIGSWRRFLELYLSNPDALQL